MSQKGIEIRINDKQLVDEMTDNIKDAIERIFNTNGEMKEKLFDKIVEKSAYYYNDYNRNNYTVDKIIRKAIIESAIKGAKLTDKKFSDYLNKLDVKVDRLSEDELIGVYFEFHVRNIVEEIAVEKVKEMFSK